MSVVSQWKGGPLQGLSGPEHPSGPVNLTELSDLDLAGVEAGVSRYRADPEAFEASLGSG